MKKLKNLTNLFILTALFIVVGSPSPDVLASPDAAPDLASAASFVGLASSTFTNTGSGVYVGNVGVSPGTSVTGFPPGTVINGSIYTDADPVAVQAQTDALAAYNNLVGQTCNINLTGLDLGDLMPTPGVYCFDKSAGLTGDLVLDALDNPLAVWVFQMGSTLDAAVDSSVVLINGGQALNVYWQVGTSATINTRSQFKGNILAKESITLNAGASLIGRALALTGAVTMDTHGSGPFITPIIANTPLFLFYNMPQVKR